MEKGVCAAWSLITSPVGEADQQETLLLVEDRECQRGWVELALRRELEFTKTRIWAPATLARLDVKLHLLQRARKTVRMLVTDLHLDEWKVGLDAVELADRLRPVVASDTIVILASVEELSVVRQKARELSTKLGVHVQPISKTQRGYVHLVAEGVKRLAKVG